NQIPSDLARQVLNEIVTEEFEGLNLPPKLRKVLRTLAEKKEARPKDYAGFGCSSAQDFYSNYIGKLHAQHLLTRRQQGRAVYYALRVIAVLAYELDLLKNGPSSS